MEIMNPYTIYIGIPVVVVLALITFGFRKKFKDGRKVANTEDIEKTKYFRRRLLEYRIFSVTVIVSLVLALSIVMCILARPFRSKQNITEIHNRDIFLCLDTSGSMFEVDLEVCERLKDFVMGLQGERFGITIFNCQTVTLVPLTTDYEYIIEVLDQIEEACRIAIDVLENGSYYDSEEYAQYQYIIDGTITYDYESGSSLIGDGLASTVFQFPGVKDDDSRTRVILLATDNELWGEPFVQLDEAAAICKKYGVKVFAAAPEYVVDYDGYKAAVESTGGKLFTLASKTMAKDIIKEVEKTETSVIYKSEVQITEFPEKLVGGVTIALLIYFAASRRIKL